MKRESLIRSLFLVGLSISVLLVRDYAAPVSLVCGEAGGCDLVKASPFAKLFGVSTPLLGVLFFATALGLSIFARARILLKILCGLSVLAALTFIGLQLFVIEAICPYCMVVDASALVAAALVLSETRAASSHPKLLWPTFAGVALSLALPLSWSPEEPPKEAPKEEAQASSLPPPLAVEQRPGMVTVVEFLDLDCEECRKEDAVLRELAEHHSDKVRIVRKVLSAEERARASAKALCCASQLGFGDQMASALLSQPLPTPDELESIAARLNLDPVLYRDCMDSSWSNEQVSRAVEDASVLGVEALPAVWINAERLDGHRSAEELKSCLENAFQSL